MDDVVLSNFIISIASNKEQGSSSIRKDCVDKTKAHWVTQLDIVQKQQSGTRCDGDCPHETFYDIT
jgi:hypothetical protein